MEEAKWAEKDIGTKKNFTIFLANGKTLHFTNVQKIEDRIDDNNNPYCVVHYFGKSTNKKRTAYFQLTNDNVIGYAVDK